MVDLEALAAELNELKATVPFGHSPYQIRKMIVGAHPGKPRARRQAILEMDKKFKALAEAQFRRDRTVIDLEEIDFKLQSAEGFDRRRLEIDKLEKQFNLSYEEKLLLDAIEEYSIHRSEVLAMPQFTREEFNAAEPSYWKERLQDNARRDVLASGTISPGIQEALEQVGLNPYEERTLLLKELHNADLLHLQALKAPGLLAEPQDPVARGVRRASPDLRRLVDRHRHGRSRTGGSRVPGPRDSGAHP